MSNITNMNLKEYKEFHTTTVQKDFSLLYYGVGLGGESGEVLNEIKKIYRKNQEEDKPVLKEDRQKLILEMGDVVWYLTAMAKKIDVTLEEVLKMNKEKLTERMKKLNSGK